MNRKVRIGLGIALVCIVVVFFIWRYRSKSTYAINTISTSTDPTDNLFYSNLTTCQNTFVTSTLGDLVMHQSITCSGSSVTVGTVFPHNYANNDTVYVQGVSSDGSGDPVSGYNSSSTTSIDASGNAILTLGSPVTVTTSSSNIYQFTYTSPTPCTGTPASFGYSWKSTATNVNSAFDTRTGCMNTQLQSYINTKCPWAIQQADQTFPQPTDPTLLAAYTQMQTEIGQIKDAYAPLIQNAMAGLPGQGDYNVIKAARQADFTSATRKYLQSVCPGFYQLNGTVDPGSNQITQGRKFATSPYSAFTTTPPTNPATTPGAWFDGSLINLTNINAWNTVSQMTGTLTQYYSSDSTIAKLAGDMGPGTVTMYGTVYDRGNGTPKLTLS